MKTKDSGSITLSTVIRQSDDQVSADMGGEVALMSIENGKYYCLNDTSSRIWQLIEQPCRVGHVCSALQDEFEVQEDQCEGDVLEHLKELIGDDLVEIVDAAAA